MTLAVSTGAYVIHPVYTPDRMVRITRRADGKTITLEGQRADDFLFDLQEAQEKLCRDWMSGKEVSDER